MNIEILISELTLKQNDCERHLRTAGKRLSAQPVRTLADEVTFAIASRMEVTRRLTERLKRMRLEGLSDRSIFSNVENWLFEESARHASLGHGLRGYMQRIQHQTYVDALVHLYEPKAW